MAFPDRFYSDQNAGVNPPLAPNVEEKTHSLTGSLGGQHTVELNGHPDDGTQRLPEVLVFVPIEQQSSPPVAAQSHHDQEEKYIPEHQFSVGDSSDITSQFSLNILYPPHVQEHQEGPVAEHQEPAPSSEPEFHFVPAAEPELQIIRPEHPGGAPTGAPAAPAAPLAAPAEPGPAPAVIPTKIASPQSPKAQQKPQHESLHMEIGLLLAEVEKHKSLGETGKVNAMAALWNAAGSLKKLERLMKDQPTTEIKKSYKDAEKAFKKYRGITGMGRFNISSLEKLSKSESDLDKHGEKLQKIEEKLEKNEALTFKEMSDLQGFANIVGKRVCTDCIKGSKNNLGQLALTNLSAHKNCWDRIMNSFSPNVTKMMQTMCREILKNKETLALEPDEKDRISDFVKQSIPMALVMPQTVAKISSQALEGYDMTQRKGSLASVEVGIKNLVDSALAKIAAKKTDILEEKAKVDIKKAEVDRKKAEKGEIVDLGLPERTFIKVSDELFSTEKSFVNSIQKYELFLLEMYNSKPPGITAAEFATLSTRNTLETVEESQIDTVQPRTKEGIKANLLKAFDPVNLQKRFLSFIQYTNKYNQIIEILKNKGKDKNFQKLAQEFQKSNNLTLEAVAITPIQRGPRYVLLLKELVKLDNDFADSLAASETFGSVVNEAKRLSETTALK